MNGYMFDTNIFNDLLDNKEMDVNQFSGTKCYVTHIQHDEIMQTKDLDRRIKLENTFFVIDKQTIPTESFVLGTSRLDQAKLGDGDLYKELLSILNKKKRMPNNHKDALIAETAIIHKLTLVTHDSALFSSVTQMGGATCNLNHILLSKLIK